MYTLRKAARRLAARACVAVGLASTLLLAGCGSFFVCQKASCPSSGSGTGSTGSGSTTTDYVYISNAAKGPTYVSEYDISTGSLAAISGSPYNVGFAPVAMVVSPSDSYLYAATPAGVTTPGIYLFSIGTTGALSTANNGAALISGVAISSMAISPDGNFLFTVDTGGSTLTEYQISSGGLLALVNSVQLPAGGCSLSGNPSGGSPLNQTCTVTVAPSGQFVVASLGSEGTYIFPYSSTSGVSTTSSTHIASASTQSGDFSVTLDKNNYLYIARTDALAAYQITDTSGDAHETSSVTYPSSTTTPRSVVLSSSGDDVYTANLGTGNISGYSIASGVLTALSNSPFTGPASVSAIGVDKSGTYMVAAGFDGSSGIQLFTIGSDGSLTLGNSAGTGTSMDYPVILAMTH